MKTEFDFFMDLVNNMQSTHAKSNITYESLANLTIMAKKLWLDYMKERENY